MKLQTSVIFIGLLLAGICCKTKQPVESTANTSTEKVKSESNSAHVNVDVVEGLNLGNKAPEFEMLDVNDKPFKLSSLKGKMVLIDFWASWCMPCRAENPSVVEAYNKYQTIPFKEGNGFEVLSVSLDSKKDAWVKAIAKDGLKWPYHVSDLMGWNNAVAQRYNITTIPNNFLINGDGIIVAKNLRGENLLNKIESLKK